MLGNQLPTFQVVGNIAFSNADLAIGMFEEDAGASFMGHQEYEFHVYMARNEDGSPAGKLICISIPRQNGKSYAARFYAAYAADFEHKRVLYSAHNGKTTREMFLALLKIYDDPVRFPECYENVKKITRAKGYERIEFKEWIDADGFWHDGGCIDFSTRTKNGARGGTYQLIILDEAQELTDEQYDAILPTVSAGSDVEDVKARPQVIMIGTPPGPTCNGTVFRRAHDSAHENKDPEAGWWMEWAYVTEDMEKADISLENCVDLAQQTNPAMGYRIDENTIRTEFTSMSKDGFARERLGWWSVLAAVIDFAIDHKKWAECASRSQKPEGKTAYGIKFSSDGSEVTLCGAVIGPDGKARISLIEKKTTSHGTQWLAIWLNQRYKKASCVVIDGRNGVDFLIEKISDTWLAKGSIVKPSAKDVVAAASQLTNEVYEKTVTWYELQDMVNESALQVTKRPIAGGWGFGGEQADIMHAASLALWGCRISKRDPERKMRIG